MEQRYRVESLLLQHRSKVCDLERAAAQSPHAEVKGRFGADDIDDGVRDLRGQIDSHKESIQALQVSLTPAEIDQLSSLASRLAK